MFSSLENACVQCTSMSPLKSDVNNWVWSPSFGRHGVLRLLVTVTVAARPGQRERERERASERENMVVVEVVAM